MTMPPTRAGMATATGKPPEDEVVVVEDDAEADATTVSVTMLAGAGSRRTGVGAIIMGGGVQAAVINQHGREGELRFTYLDVDEDGL